MIKPSTMFYSERYKEITFSCNEGIWGFMAPNPTPGMRWDWFFNKEECIALRMDTVPFDEQIKIMRKGIDRYLSIAEG